MTLHATLMLAFVYAQVQAAPAATPVASPAAAASAAIQARIARVEQGLSTRIVVKGSPDRRMTLADRMAFHQVPAASIAVINDGRIEWARAYGVLDATRRRPATPASLFQAASVSKSVSAIGALHMVEQGKLSLDADANRQLAAWKIPQNEFTRDSKVTLRRLLNHSAGLTVHGFEGYAAGQDVPTLLAILDGTPPANSAPVRVAAVPGSAWTYSGGGYSVVQLMMTEAGKQPFEPLMRALVLDPLDMTRSTFAQTLPESWRDAAATAHDADGKAIEGRWHVYPESAAAGLWTTPSNLARVVIEVQRAEAGKSGRVLSKAMTTAMLTRGLGEYGLGFFVENLGDRTSFGHSGGTTGFRSQLYGYTKSGQGIVVMTNSDNGAALIDELLCSVAAEYGWPEYRVVEKTALPADAALNRKAAGDYRLVNLPAHVVAEGERLYFQSELFGRRRMELFRESDDTFFMTAQDMTIAFEHGDGGEIVGFALKRGSNTYAGTKTR